MMSHSSRPDSAPLTFAMTIAKVAAERVQELRGRGKWTGKMLAELGDHAADGYLVGRIAERYPDDGLLSEETKDSPARLSKRRVWIIDPIDGSQEYGKFTNEWAVQVALVENGRLVLGALGLADGRVIGGVSRSGSEWSLLEGPGTLADGQSESPRRLRIVMSKNHTPDWTRAFLEKLDAEISLHSGVGYKTARVLLGEADVYVHEGKVALNEWDTAAPEAVARALGWSVTDLHGDSLRYNRAQPQTGSFVLCRPADRIRVLAALAGVGAT